MDNELIKIASELGINASLYNLLPAKNRESLLRKDIEKEKRRKEEEKRSES